jgi:hypothetical protein
VKWQSLTATVEQQRYAAQPVGWGSTKKHLLVLIVADEAL